MPKPKHSAIMHELMKIGLLDASFDTCNMGITALAESAIKCILHRWSDANITLLGNGQASCGSQRNIERFEIFSSE